MQKMMNFDDVTKKTIKKNIIEIGQNFFYHPYKISTIWSSGSEKTSLSFNLINHQQDIDKT